jgi:hypothetical protein
MSFPCHFPARRAAEIGIVKIQNRYPDVVIRDLLQQSANAPSELEIKRRIVATSRPK